MNGLHLSINFGLAVALLLCASPAWPQTSKPDAQQLPGTINGTIVDDTGAAIAGAKVTLSHDGISPGTEVLSREDGQFFFPNVSSGPYRLTVSASGFAGQTWKSRLDPVQFAVVGIIAGVQHARNDYSGFGEGAEGYARRYAAAYGNVLTRSLITQVVLPSLFRQDPRYF